MACRAIFKHPSSLAQNTPLPEHKRLPRQDGGSDSHYYVVAPGFGKTHQRKPIRWRLIWTKKKEERKQQTLSGGRWRACRRRLVLHLLQIASCSQAPPRIRQDAEERRTEPTSQPASACVVIMNNFSQFFRRTLRLLREGTGTTHIHPSSTDHRLPCAVICVMSAEPWATTCLRDGNVVL